MYNETVPFFFHSYTGSIQARNFLVLEERFVDGAAVKHRFLHHGIYILKTVRGETTSRRRRLTSAWPSFWPSAEPLTRLARLTAGEVLSTAYQLVPGMCVDFFARSNFRTLHSRRKPISWPYSANHPGPSICTRPSKGVTILWPCCHFETVR